MNNAERRKPNTWLPRHAQQINGREGETATLLKRFFVARSCLWLVSPQVISIVGHLPFNFMATDSLKLFNKKLADSIMTKSDDELFAFVAEHLAELKQIDLPQSAFLYEIESVANLESEGFDKRDFFEQALAERENLVVDLCLSKEEVYLDYWVTMSEVFDTDYPEGSISIEELLPSLAEEPTLLLLQPQHIEQMLQSLEKHRNDLSIMDEKSIAKVKVFKEHCEKNPEYFVAYEFDL